MSKYDSDGEVYGSKVLTFAIIAASALILGGLIWSPPAQSHHAAQAQVQTEQVVVTAHPATAQVNG